MNEDELYERQESMASDIRKLLNDIPNDDENIEKLNDAMSFYCGNWNICEGFKDAITLELSDQSDEYAENIEHMQTLLDILSK